MDNLKHNRSRQLSRPSVEVEVEVEAAAASTTTIDELKHRLTLNAKDALTSYLMKWRVERRNQQSSRHDTGGRGGRRSQDSRKIDIVSFLRQRRERKGGFHRRCLFRNHGFLSQFAFSNLSAKRSTQNPPLSLFCLQVVDTTLVSLLAEANRPLDIRVLLASANDCVVERVERSLVDAGSYQLVAELALRRGDSIKALQVWTK